MTDLQDDSGARELADKWDSAIAVAYNEYSHGQRAAYEDCSRQLKAALSRPAIAPQATPAAVDDAMVYRAARVLSKRHADECNTDREDTWKTYSESFAEDARAMLTAALAVPPAEVKP